MKTKAELNALKQEYETLNNKLRELTEEELMQVTGGGYHGEMADYLIDPPNKSFYTVEQHLIIVGLVVRRVVDRKQFRCVGYENNNDKSTSWVFHNISGTEENIICCAHKYDEILSEFCLT